jgi:hypothetical protein
MCSISGYFVIRSYLDQNKSEGCEGARVRGCEGARARGCEGVRARRQVGTRARERACARPIEGEGALERGRESVRALVAARARRPVGGGKFF